jgi:hypothetical protein
VGDRALLHLYGALLTCKIQFATFRINFVILRSFVLSVLEFFTSNTFSNVAPYFKTLQSLDLHYPVDPMFKDSICLIFMFSVKLFCICSLVF